MKKISICIALLLGTGLSHIYANNSISTPLDNLHLLPLQIQDTVLQNDTIERKDISVPETENEGKQQIQDLKNDVQDEIEQRKQDLKESVNDTKEALRENFNQAKEGISNWFNENIVANTVGDFQEVQRQNNYLFSTHIQGKWTEYALSVTSRPDYPDGQFFNLRSEADPKVSDSMRNISVLSAETLSDIETLQPPVPEIYYPGAGTDAISNLMTKNFLTLKWQGETLKVYYLPSLRQAGMGKGTEKHVAKFWDHLSQEDYYPVLFQLYQFKEEKGLNDYQYYQLVRTFARSLFEKGKRGEEAAFCVFLLNQTGYDARLARLETEESREMVVLLPIFEKITELPFITLGDNPYYLIDRPLTRKETDAKIYTYDKAFALAKHPFSIRFDPSKCQLQPIYGKFQDYVFNERIAEMQNELPFAPVQLIGDAPFSTLMQKTLEFRFRSDVDSMIEKKQDANLKHILSEREKQELKVLHTAQFIQKNFAKSNKRSVKFEGIMYPDQMFFKKGNGDILDKSLLLGKICHEILGIPALVVIFDNYATTAVMLDPNSKATENSPFNTASYIDIDGNRYYLCSRLPKEVNPAHGFKIYRW